MNASINCGLKGAYKVELFSGAGKNRKLVEETDWFSNDITNYGLNYPFTYPFARCFMFLSLGSGAGGNAHPNRQKSTGLYQPISSFWAYDPINGSYRQTGQYIGWQGYEIGGPHNGDFDGTFSSACGTKFTANGVNLYRGWTIPTGAIENGTVMGETLNIEGFMTSPSSGIDATGNLAFSLVDRSIQIPSGYTATVTYQLSLNFLNYANYQTFASTGGYNPSGYFDTGKAATGTLIPGSELPLLSGWSCLSGIYRQIFPAVQFIDAMGACVVSPLGDQLEPSYTDCKKLYFYMTPDISQFSVSKFGSADVSELSSYQSTGLMANYTDFVTKVGGTLNIHSDSEISFPNEPYKWYYGGDSAKTAKVIQEPTLSNIRLENLLPINDYASGPILKDTFTYQDKGYVSPILSKQPIAFATPGKPIDPNYADYGQKAVYSSYLKRLAIDAGVLSTGALGISNRNKTATKRALFSPIQSAGTNTRFGSLTLAYLSTAGSVPDLIFEPYVDFLFFDSSGRGADMPHYRYIPDIYLVERGSGVANAFLSIVGQDSNIPSSVKRFASGQLFMGPGGSTSGIDITNPLFTTLVPGTINQYSGYFLPGSSSSQYAPGTGYSQKIIGYDENDNPIWNPPTIGWGTVYGVLANKYFYDQAIDIALIENKTWNGQTWANNFSSNGGIPNPTGESLFWLNTGNILRANISNVSYYDPYIGYLNDTGDYFSNIGVQLIQDAIYQNGDYTNDLTQIDTDRIGDGGYGFIFVTGSGVPITINRVLTNDTSIWPQSLIDSLSGALIGGSSLNGKKLPLVIDSQPTYIQLMGIGTDLTARGYGQNLLGTDISNGNLISSGFGPTINVNTGVYLAIGRIDPYTYISRAYSSSLPAIGSGKYYSITGMSGRYKNVSNNLVNFNLVDVIQSNGQQIYLSTGDYYGDPFVADGTYVSGLINITDLQTAFNTSSSFIENGSLPYFVLYLYEDGVGNIKNIPLSFNGDNNSYAYISQISGITYRPNESDFLGYNEKWTQDRTGKFSINVNQAFTKNVSLVYSDGTNYSFINNGGNATPNFTALSTGRYKILSDARLYNSGINFLVGQQASSYPVYLGPTGVKTFSDLSPYALTYTTNSSKTGIFDYFLFQDYVFHNSKITNSYSTELNVVFVDSNQNTVYSGKTYLVDNSNFLKNSQGKAQLDFSKLVTFSFGENDNLINFDNIYLSSLYGIQTLTTRKDYKYFRKSSWETIHIPTLDRSEITAVTSTLYPYVVSQQNYLNFTPITGNSSFVLTPTSFKKPSGIIHHIEAINDSGRRLLPNYATPNNQGINYYSPVKGGSYPGLSTENAMEIYFDFKWSGG
jgi:hypothetical protein